MIFTNPALITIPIFGAATPYPSTIPVIGAPTTLSSVTVTLNGLSHTFPSDIRVMVESPNGHNLVLMFARGGGTDIIGVTLTFDDTAATTLPPVIVSGTYLPTPPIISPSSLPNLPAPAPSSDQPGAIDNSNALTKAFTGPGNNPNGTWNLWVMDAVGGDMGSISGGWTLTLI